MNSNSNMWEQLLHLLWFLKGYMSQNIDCNYKAALISLGSVIKLVAGLITLKGLIVKTAVFE